jgi:hypothetical protein
LDCKWLRIAWFIFQILVVAALIAIPVLFVIYGETPVSYNGEPPERGGLVP